MATEQQVPKLVAGLVEHQSAFAALSIEDAQWVILNTKEAIALACTAIQNRAKAVTQTVVDLLQSLGEIAFPGATKFVASKRLVQNTDETAIVKISGFGSNFTSWFLGKTETNVKPSKLGYGKILRRAKATVICAFLGGEASSETSLAEIFYLVSLQPKGQSGVLLTNGWANIFFVRDVNGVLRLVLVRWDDGGWYWGARGLSREYEWNEDHQVFSRKAA